VGDGQQAWLTEPQLIEQLQRTRGEGGRVIDSRDHPDAPPAPWVDAVFQRIVASRPAAIQLLAEPHPVASRHAASGQTVLMKAAYQGKRHLVEDLLRRGVPLDVVNAQGHTALMLAAYTGQREEVRLLLAAGADPTIRAKSGHTAADMARARGHDEIAAMISAGGGQGGQ
jgi:ankyrin repeat protein